MQKKVVLGIGALAVVLIGGVAFAMTRDSGEPVQVVEETTKKKKIVRPVNVIPEEERAFMRIIPEADGRNITVTVESLGRPAQTTEHELEYQAGTLLQGLFYTLELDSLPASTTKLMGSCSAGGACTYHEDVRGGSLLANFEDGAEGYSLKSDWKYIDNATGETQASSKDAKFQIEGPGLARARYMVIYNSPGYPKEIPGTVASDTYSFAPSSTLTGEVELTMRARTEGALSIAVWDGSAWSSVEGEVDGKTITASVPIAQAYTVISQ